MMLAALAAIGLVSGMPAVLIAGFGLAITRPSWVLGAGTVLAVRDRLRGRDENDEARFLQAVASELRGGASLRQALATAAEATPALGLAMCAAASRSGVPLHRVGSDLESRLIATGHAAAAAVELAGEVGGASAAMFENLARLAYEDDRFRRDLRVATSQARLSALVIAGLPVAFLAFMAAIGKFDDLWHTSRFLLLAGAGLVIVGLMVLTAMARRTGVRHRGGRRAPQEELELLAGLLVVSLMAGLTLHDALHRASFRLDPDLRSDVERTLRRSRREGLALALGSSPGKGGWLFASLARAQATGAPVAASVAVGLDEARDRRRTAAEEATRRLPIRMLMPMALLVLPGFLLLTVGPSVVTSLDRVIGPFIAP